MTKQRRRGCVGSVGLKARTSPLSSCDCQRETPVAPTAGTRPRPRSPPDRSHHGIQQRGIAAAKAATPTIPIVMDYGDDPVRQGYIASLADRVATLPAEPRSSLRRLRRFMGREWSRWWNAAVRSRGSPFVDPNDPSSGPGSGEAIQIIGGPFMYSARAQIAEMAMQHGLPTAYPWRAGPEAGGLLSCGMNLPAAWRRVTVYVDKILKGAKPADLPVEQPTSSNWSSTSGPPRPSA